MRPHTEELPFGQGPDPVLRTALRDALEGRAPEAFVARLQAALPARREGSVDVLARWAPWGMAAAAVGALALWGALEGGSPRLGAMAASALVHMEVALGQSEGEVLVISLMEDR